MRVVRGRVIRLCCWYSLFEVEAFLVRDLRKKGFMERKFSKLKIDV